MEQMLRFAGMTRGEGAAFLVVLSAAFPVLPSVRASSNAPV